MSYKHDTFWEKHPPVGVGEPYAPGLSVYEAVDNRQTLAYFLSMALGFVLLISLAYSNNKWTMYLGATAILQMLFWPGLSNIVARYRLYKDGDDAPEFEGESKRLHALLRDIVADARLWRCLAPPERLHYPPPSVFKQVFPVLSLLIPMAIVVGASYLLLLVMFVLSPPYSAFEILMLSVVLVGAGFLVLPLWIAHRRLRPGMRLFGSGAPEFDGEDIRKHLEQVKRAELRWDRWLGAPYLLLQLDGMKVRYYSPSEERLHLLRLARHYMPHLELRV